MGPRMVRIETTKEYKELMQDQMGYECSDDRDDAASGLRTESKLTSLGTMRTASYYEKDMQTLTH